MRLDEEGNIEIPDKVVAIVLIIVLTLVVGMLYILKDPEMIRPESQVTNFSFSESEECKRLDFVSGSVEIRCTQTKCVNIQDEKYCSKEETIYR